MYAAHFAAGLAVKGRVPQASTWALMTAVFLPDFVWILLARLDIEPELPPRGFFDDWSHSLLMIIIWSTLFAAMFWKRQRAVSIAIWIAGLSHFLLDFLIHPARLVLYPHSAIHIGWNLWQYGQQKGFLGPSHYWWIEGAAMVTLLFVFVFYSQRFLFQPKLVAASCLLVIGLHLLSV